MTRDEVTAVVTGRTRVHHRSCGYGIVVAPLPEGVRDGRGNLLVQFEGEDWISSVSPRDLEVVDA